MPKIAVVGSLNMDLVVETERIPNKGETLIGKNFFMCPGGKGANQAVAASRLGSKVSMFGSVGKDENGKLLINNLKAQNIDTAEINIVSDDIPTGVAVISIYEKDNTIIVVPGANSLTSIGYLDTIKESLLDFDVILLQIEIPMAGIEYLVNYLYENHKVIILNPAPAEKLSKELIEKVTYITPNEHEYSIIFDSKEKMDTLLKQYPNKLIITQGEKGVRFFNGKDLVLIPCIKVDTLDTTGAGDTFSGAFGVAISEGKGVRESIAFAGIAAGLSVTKMGAQGGMPTKDDVARYISALEV